MILVLLLFALIAAVAVGGIRRTDDVLDGRIDIDDERANPARAAALVLLAAVLTLLMLAAMGASLVGGTAP